MLFSYSLFISSVMKMAAADDLSMNSDSIDVNKNVAWVPLSLTFVEYPQGSIQII